MVRLTPGGNIPTIRLQGRSLYMMDAGRPASKPLETSIRAAKTERSRWSRPDRQRCGLFHELCSGEGRGGGVPINGTELARLRQAQQASASGAWLDELQ